MDLNKERRRRFPSVGGLRTDDAIAWLMALGLFGALALFGARYHWVEEAGSAERDGYVSQAQEILAGSLPRDPYRPLLYPLLTAGLSLAVGDPFLAARLLSNVAAAALAWLAFAFGKRLGGAGVGAWAMALTAVNPNLWVLGQHVSTDALFAALAAGALLAGLDYAMPSRGSGAGPAPHPWPAVLAAGSLLGLAAFTRANAWFLVPSLLLAWWWAPHRRGRKGVHLAAAAGLAVVALLPHWGLRSAVFGDPFYSENWKNLAFKLYGFPDWSYLERVPFSGLVEVVAHDPWAVGAGGMSEIGRFLSSGLAQLLGTWPHVGLLVLGSWICHREKPRATRLLLLGGGTFLAAVALAFFTWGRLVLLLLPVAAALSAMTWRLSGLPTACGLSVAGLGTRPALRRALCGALALAVLLLAVKTFAFRLPAFVQRHPYAEVATLRTLEAQLPAGAVIAGTSPFLGRYLRDRQRYLYVPDAFGPEVESPALYFERLGSLLHESGAACLVVGSLDLRDRPQSLLTGPPPVPWLYPYRLEGAAGETPPETQTAPVGTEVRVYRILWPR